MSIDWSKFPRDVNTPNYVMRPAFLHVRDRMGKWLRGAEIGIYLGETAEYALRNMNLTEYVMIDPYIPHGDMQRSAEDWSEIYEKISKLFSVRKNVRFMRATSEDAAKTFPDGYFDFVYIDGNHEYNYVEKDLNSWYNKVKAGGVLCGHDYGNEPTWAGVKKAVDEFAARNNLVVHHKEDWYTHVHDWWIDKEAEDPRVHFKRDDVTLPWYELRPMFKHVKDKMGTGLVGAEVGIFLGEMAEYNLKLMEPKKYYMIDKYRDMVGQCQPYWDKLYEWISGIFSDKPNAEFIRECSLVAVDRFEDESLDFVYIDDYHATEHVLKELPVWWKKIKKGGVLGGHDYGHELDKSWCGVTEAVDKWVAENNLKLNVQRGPTYGGSICDWWVDK